MKLLEFILSNFWVFFGFWILISVFLDFTIKLVNRVLRHYNIRKHGYPPPHCDADGDFKEEDIEN
jgi:hypothetical protein